MIAMAIGVGKIREEIPDADLEAGVWLTVVGWVFALLVPFLSSGGGKRFCAACCNPNAPPPFPQQPNAGMMMQPMQGGAMFMQQPTVQMQPPTGAMQTMQGGAMFVQQPTMQMQPPSDTGTFEGQTHSSPP